MRVYVRDGAGEEFVISLPVGATLGDLKFEIFEVAGISSEYYKLIFQCENLDEILVDGDLLRDAEIEDGSVIQLLMVGYMDEIKNYYQARQMRSVKALKAIIERGNLQNIEWYHAYDPHHYMYDETGEMAELMFGTFPGLEIHDNANMDHRRYFERSRGATQSEEQFLMAGLDPSFPSNRGETTVLNPFVASSKRKCVTPDAFVEAGAIVRPNWEEVHKMQTFPADRNYEWIEYLHSLGF